ncbi:hypothetical protein PCASD_00188 [Puccinia coronata f. sp. avenae]|uniref:Nucleolar protein 12 n=1 Tax=Puccinia coronata f. sp. avenae TaxID=200324 RepID=A0A2N5VQI4_9BASI|nr:hypothetical protein PCASD_00188 [Puccinia coronata f. sp. avenae]
MKQSKKKNSHPTNTSHATAHLLADPEKMDNELDSLFASSTFTPLEPIPVKGDVPEVPDETGKNPPPVSPGTKPSSKQEQKKTTQTRSSKKEKTGSSPHQPRKPRHNQSSVEVSYETKMAIERAKRFAQQLKQDALHPDKPSSVKPTQPVHSTPPSIHSLNSDHHSTNHSQSDAQHSEADQQDSDADEQDSESDQQDSEADQQDSEEEDEQDSKDDEQVSEGDEQVSEGDDQDSEAGQKDSDIPLVHETVLARTTSASLPKPKTRKPAKVDPTETPEQKNARTVFVGNVHIDCVKNKSTSRALLEHLLNPLKEETALGTQARIESIRYRGIPLATPIGSEPPKNQHGAKRSKAWQEAKGGSRPSFDDVTGGSAGRRGAKPLDSGETNAAPVKFLTSGQKRMIGYVTGDLHPEAKSCLAYVVIAPPANGTEGSTELTGAAELAKLIVTKADGTSFMDRVIRCDLAAPPPTTSSGTSSHPSIDLKEQRRTLFIGGLDFVEEEDSIRKAVESRLLEEKKGLPEGAPTWVERVRVVRDKATSLTKGFAYVLLRTQDAVEEMLALPPGSFKIGKRKVRLQKYLSAGQSSALKRTREEGSSSKPEKRSKLNAGDPSGTTTRAQPKKPRIDLTKPIDTGYKGPDLSQELASLDKNARKKIKSANQLRVERRMLKKQNKIKLTILDSHAKSGKKSELHQVLKPFKSATSKLAKDNRHVTENKKKKKKLPPSESHTKRHAHASKPKSGSSKT